MDEFIERKKSVNVITKTSSRLFIFHICNINFAAIIQKDQRFFRNRCPKRCHFDFWTRTSRLLMLDSAYPYHTLLKHNRSVRKYFDDINFLILTETDVRGETQLLSKDQRSTPHLCSLMASPIIPAAPPMGVGGGGPVVGCTPPIPATPPTSPAAPADARCAATAAPTVNSGFTRAIALCNGNMFLADPAGLCFNNQIYIYIASRSSPFDLMNLASLLKPLSYVFWQGNQIDESRTSDK